MKAEEAKAKTDETRNKLVGEQLETARGLIKRGVDEGEFSVSEHCYKFRSTRSVGWLDEVVEELRGDGYSVQLTEGTLTIGWKHTKPAANEEPILEVEGTTFDEDNAGRWTILAIFSALAAYLYYLS